jgi:hypothetical protein
MVRSYSEVAFGGRKATYFPAFIPILLELEGSL